MDDSVYSFLLFLILVFIIWRLTKKPSKGTVFTRTVGGNGEIAESIIVSIIEKEIKKGLYGYVLHNLYLPKVDGGTTEVDVVLICTKGVYAIESKNYSGYIFGDEQQRYWTVTLNAGRDLVGFRQIEKHKFYNPIWQNNTHIRYLRNVIGKTIPIESIIIFSDHCTFKNLSYDINKVTIMHLVSLKHYISSVRDLSEDIMSQDRVDYLYNTLLPYTDIDEEKKQSHLSYVNELQNNPTRCPRCGGNLVIRTAKKGSNVGRQFYGCSNYPKCKYTRNIE